MISHGKVTRFKIYLKEQRLIKKMGQNGYFSNQIYHKSHQTSTHKHLIKSTTSSLKKLILLSIFFLLIS